ncbi:MAG: 4Fe-4S dicluster domain-containing protein [Candidatus Lindowbacteria bacterium]|nr:4Fe-4S dicluster domain-containing protein [Candidatus Lindowbacteria bacterium]
MKTQEETTRLVRYGMTIDVDKCTGCGNCAVACHMENNVPCRSDETDKSRNIAWMRIYKVTNGAEYPLTRIAFFPRPCMQCDHHTPCVSVCPARATNYDELTGVVDQINTRCIGCRYCMAACPYMVRCFNWWDPVWVGDMEKQLNPDVAPRMRGVVEKCTFCSHRYQKAKNKAHNDGRGYLKEDEYVPACVEACPVGAMRFGDLNNPEHEVSRLIKSPRAFRLLEKLNTEPKVYYLSSHSWITELADNYV